MSRRRSSITTFSIPKARAFSIRLGTTALDPSGATPSRGSRKMCADQYLGQALGIIEAQVHEPRWCSHVAAAFAGDPLAIEGSHATGWHFMDGSGDCRDSDRRIADFPDEPVLF